VRVRGCVVWTGGKVAVCMGVCVHSRHDDIYALGLLLMHFKASRRTLRKTMVGLEATLAWAHVCAAQSWDGSGDALAIAEDLRTACGFAEEACSALKCDGAPQPIDQKPTSDGCDVLQYALWLLLMLLLLLLSLSRSLSWGVDAQGGDCVAARPGTPTSSTARCGGAA
jgi:hypothetical protein